MVGVQLKWSRNAFVVVNGIITVNLDSLSSVLFKFCIFYVINLEFLKFWAEFDLGYI